MSLSRGTESEWPESRQRRDMGLYSISVVVELTGLGPGKLRGFERIGLLAPSRTSGGTRRYSDNDLARLTRIAELMAEGMNLVAIVRILALEADNAALTAECRALRAECAAIDTVRAALQAERDATNLEYAKLHARCVALFTEIEELRKQ